MIRNKHCVGEQKKKHTTKYYIYCEQIAPSLTSLLLLLLLCTNERKKMSFIRCSKLNVLRLLFFLVVFIVLLLGRERCVGFSVFHACKICIKKRVDEQNEAFQESNLTTSFIFVPFRFNFILWRFSFWCDSDRELEKTFSFFVSFHFVMTEKCVVYAEIVQWTTYIRLCSA